MSIAWRYFYKVYYGIVLYYSFNKGHISDIQHTTLTQVPYYSVFGEDKMKQEYKHFYEKFGLNVVYYRKRKRLTQLQLAELAEVDRSHISAIELGNVGVSLDLIFKLCEVLEIKPKELFDFRES